MYLARTPVAGTFALPRSLGGLQERLATARLAREEGRELACGQLMDVQDRKGGRWKRADGFRDGGRGIPQRRAQHVVDVELEARDLSLRRFVPKAPFAARVRTRGAFDRDAGTPTDGLEGALDFGAFCEHRFPVELADVVHIDVNRQARRVEDEQIERGATLQGEASFQIRMAIESVEELEEVGDLFEDLDTEAGGRRLPLQPFAREPHDGSSHIWPMTESGTIRFHPATSRALPASRFSK